MNSTITNAPEIRSEPAGEFGRKFVKSAILATTALSLGIGFGGVALAQDASESISDAADIVVTARRTEERLQDVPISITVFSQATLENQNISTASDLAALTPSLAANNRFGSDYASFSIRGFSQETRTTASVATYFGEAVTPRGGPTLNGGDGAGPGNLFDLQNVQVLNGPQGTLFGRNTTGGAILLVPQRPTHEFGGYVQGTVGDYGEQRLQAVLNVPLGDDARLRVGMDRREREGYVNNRSGIGPDNFSDINYESYRVSFVADLAPNLENYTIASYTHSLTNGTVPAPLACTPGVIVASFPVGSTGCLSQAITPGETVSSADFYDVFNSMSDPHTSNNQWQVINTTTWDISDNLTFRNIASYAELKNYTRADVFGTCVDTNNANPLAPVTCETFANAGVGRVLDSANQNTYSEEMQLQGTNFGDRLNWQIGLYYEESDPLALTGSVSNARFSHCDVAPGDSLPSPGWNCVGFGATSMNVGSVSYQTLAAYAQGTYDVTDRLKLTTGYRYTYDRVDSHSTQMAGIYADGDGSAGSPFLPFGPNFPNGSFPAGTYVTSLCNFTFQINATPETCVQHPSTRSEAPTWTLGLDYQLTDDDMVYAKYSRGYRQASVNIFGQPGLQTTDAEQVDAYEIGAKTGFDGPFPGIFNVALFYNDLSNAQLQAGFVTTSATTALINAGGVTTYGAELSTVLELFEGFNVTASYGYLNTNVDAAPVLPLGVTPISNYRTGQELYYAPQNKLNLGASYLLPLSESIGEVTLSAGYSYVDDQLVSSDPGHPVIDSVGLVNLNANWDSMFGGPVDAALFVTNATDEEYLVARSGELFTLGLDYGVQGAPRMVGVRLKYSFGEGG